MTFKDIIGHNKTIDYLKKAIKKNELASAYLFWGSESIGKKAAAIAFARAVNCLSIDNADACGNCLSCSKIEKGIHPDVRIIAPEGETTEGKKSKVIKIEQIRAIQNEMAYPPFEGKKRVFIIDNAERMNTEAANSLLKTLEEPARNSIIILVTSRPSYLLHTIISRCQGIRFSSLSAETVKRVLIENGRGEDDAGLIAAITQGKIGSALNTDPAFIKEKRDGYFHILSNALYRGADELFFSTERYAKDSGDAEELFEWLYLWLRDIIIFKETGEERYLINLDKSSEIKKWSGIDTIALLNITRSITDIQRAFTRNINKEFALEKVLMEVKEVMYK